MHKVDKVIKSATYNQLRLNIGERIFKLRAQREWECDRWIEAITMASTTAKEFARSKVPGTRNVSKLLEAYNNGRKELQKIFLNGCEVWLPTGKQWTKDTELIAACRKLKTELIVVSIIFWFQQYTTVVQQINQNS